MPLNPNPPISGLSSTMGLFAHGVRLFFHLKRNRFHFSVQIFSINYFGSPKNLILLGTLTKTRHISQTKIRSFKFVVRSY